MPYLRHTELPVSWSELNCGLYSAANTDSGFDIYNAAFQIAIMHLKCVLTQHPNPHSVHFLMKFPFTNWDNHVTQSISFWLLYMYDSGRSLRFKIRRSPGAAMCFPVLAPTRWQGSIPLGVSTLKRSVRGRGQRRALSREINVLNERGADVRLEPQPRVRVHAGDNEFLQRPLRRDFVVSCRPVPPT